MPVSELLNLLLVFKNVFSLILKLVQVALQNVFWLLTLCGLIFHGGVVL